MPTCPPPHEQRKVNTVYFLEYGLREAMMMVAAERVQFLWELLHRKQANAASYVAAFVYEGMGC